MVKYQFDLWYLTIFCSPAKAEKSLRLEKNGELQILMAICQLGLFVAVSQDK